MIDNVNVLKKFLNELEKEDIIFGPYFYEKIKDRHYLNEKLIIESLKDTKNLLGFQTQIIRGEERYRIGKGLSNKYNLVIIIQIKDKSLYILTAWKTNRKWQKTIQK